jgi:hypothetical protein
MKHTASAYRSGTCFCDLCRLDSNRRHRRENKSRTERLKADPGLAEHGTFSTYINWGCRCDQCRDACRENTRRYRARRARAGAS